MGISLIAAFISLAFLVADPVAAKWNKRIYQRDRNKTGSQERFRKAMNRRKRYKLISLFFLILASLLAIYSIKEENYMSEKRIGELTDSINTVNRTVKSIGGRITKIEKFLWGGGGSGESSPDEPNNPTDGPDSSYRTINERFSKVEEAISDLSQRALTQEDLEQIREEIIVLRKTVTEYEKLMERIGGMPAG